MTLALEIIHRLAVHSWLQDLSGYRDEAHGSVVGGALPVSILNVGRSLAHAIKYH